MNHDPMLTTPVTWWTRLAVATTRTLETLSLAARRVGPASRGFHSPAEKRAFEDVMRAQKARSRLGLPF